MLPMGLCLYLWLAGVLGLENLAYLLIGLAVLNLFVAMLGVHAGMTYGNSRSAIATSLGTVFFLFLGVSTCLWMMVAFSGSFEAQLPSWVCWSSVGRGSTWPWASATRRRPSASPRSSARWPRSMPSPAFW